MNKIQNAVCDELTWRTHKIIADRGVQAVRPRNRWVLHVGQFCLTRAWCDEKNGWRDCEPFWSITIRHQSQTCSVNRMVLSWNTPPNPYYLHDLGLELLMMLRREMVLDDLADV